MEITPSKIYHLALTGNELMLVEEILRKAPVGYEVVAPILNNIENRVCEPPKPQLKVAEVPPQKAVTGQAIETKPPATRQPPNPNKSASHRR